MVSRFSVSSVSSRVSGVGVAPASVVASRRWAWRRAFNSGGSALCRAEGLPVFASWWLALKAAAQFAGSFQCFVFHQGAWWLSQADDGLVHGLRRV